MQEPVPGHPSRRQLMTSSTGAFANSWEQMHGTCCLP
ncbi:MAG: hypothetical protein HKP56_13440, partial [Anderseniella sp.]|nr:hypothetical protein [Anderseniella sp.]